MTGDETNSAEGLRDIGSYFFDWLQCIVFALLFVVALFTFIGKPMEVNQISMNPTLYEGDRLVVSNLFYTPDNGDIVVFAKKTYDDGTPLVKRIIATAGQTVEIDTDEGIVAVDGIVLDEPYINEATKTIYDVNFPLTVPDGYVFVMGDNRNHSKDSRSSAVGLVDTREVLGKVVAVMLPASNFKIF